MYEVHASKIELLDLKKNNIFLRKNIRER